MVVSSLPYASILKKEATCSSYTSVDFQPTLRWLIPEDVTLHNHRCVNLKCYIVEGVSQSQELTVLLNRSQINTEMFSQR
jgi:hypothetical protein